MKPAAPAVIVDTREKLPWDFSASGRGVVRAALDAGDYSLAGMERVAAVERKSVDDLVHTLVHDRRRFGDELVRLSRLRRAWVIVDGSVADLVAHCDRTRGATARSVLAACAALDVSWRVPVLWAGNRAAAAQYALTLLDRARIFVSGGSSDDSDDPALRADRRVGNFPGLPSD